jgi:hypothetical protein
MMCSNDDRDGQYSTETTCSHNSRYGQYLTGETSCSFLGLDSNERSGVGPPTLTNPFLGPVRTTFSGFQLMNL